MSFRLVLKNHREIDTFKSFQTRTDIPHTISNFRYAGSYSDPKERASMTITCENLKTEREFRKALPGKCHYVISWYEISLPPTEDERERQRIFAETKCSFLAFAEEVGANPLLARRAANALYYGDVLSDDKWLSLSDSELYNLNCVGENTLAFLQLYKENISYK